MALIPGVSHGMYRATVLGTPDPKEVASMPRGLSVIEHKVLGASAFRCLRTVLLLVALQVPMRVAVEPGDCAGPLRLALLVDVGLCLALLAAAMRFAEYLGANCPGLRCRVAGRWASIGLTVGAVLKLVDDAIVWQRSAGTWPGACPASVTPYLTYAGWGLSAVSLAVLIVATWHSRCDYGERANDPLRYATLRGTKVNDRPGTIIACSGGGIRSASFCLGVLQALMSSGIYQKAAAVIGVSGGGYLAAAFHMVGRGLPPKSPPPFAQGTPELALLRRSTRYLLPRGVEVFRGVMSVLYGVVVNIINITVALWVVAWVLGWYLDQYHVLPSDGNGLRFAPPTWWSVVALAPWGVAVLLFVLVEKICDRFVSIADWRRESRAFTRTAMAAGTASMMLMVLVPWSIAWVSNAEDLGVIGAALHRLVEPRGGAEVPVTIGMIGVVATSLLTLGRSVITGLGRIGEETSRIGRLLALVRVRVAPWLGTMIIVAAGYILLLRLTTEYVTSPDWLTNWANAVYLLAVVCGVRLLTDANRTSLHQFYRERLATAYLVERVDETTAQAMPFSRPLPVSEYAGARPDGGEGPELVMAAVANVVDEEFVPTGRGCVPFIIDASNTGVIGDRSLPTGGRTRTSDYEAFADFGRRDLTVPAAMAISGAAVSPLVGRASSRTRPVRVLLTVLNARLGVWLPNPYGQPPHVVRRALLLRRQYDANGPDRPRHAKVRAWEAVARAVSVASKPGPYRLLREAFGRPSLSDRKLYVTDGGHYDNLGLLEALRRRPRQVIVIDASNDAANSFGALAEAIATARMDLGVEVTVDVSPLQASGGRRAAKAWATGLATYDDSDDVTEIVFLKAQLVPRMPWDVEHYARENPDFPRRSTSRQFFDEWDFEAYRELGQDLCERMLADRARAARNAAGQPGLRSTG